MESADGSTCYGNEHHRKYRILLIFGTESCPDFRKIRVLYIQHYKNAECHEQKCNGKYGIELADYLVNRKYSGQDVIDEEGREGLIRACSMAALHISQISCLMNVHIMESFHSKNQLVHQISYKR